MVEDAASRPDERSHDRPDWWRRNQRLRERMGLPSYEPPRFDDGTYKHEVVESVEREYDCRVRFRSTNPRHPCDWDILIDGERVATVDRRRTDRGNTIYQLSTDEFVELVAEAVEAGESNESTEPGESDESNESDELDDFGKSAEFDE